MPNFSVPQSISSRHRCFTRQRQFRNGVAQANRLAIAQPVH
jgi:hypothetical protein